MKKHFKLLDILLNLFEGEGGGDAGGQGESQAAIPVPTRRGRSSGEYDKVLFGKQPAQEPTGQEGGSREPAPPSAAGKEVPAGSENTPDALEEKRKTYRDLVTGEYKQFYTEDTQKMINQRFKETKNLENQLGRQQPIIDLLMERYQIQDKDLEKLTKAVEDDDANWSEAAEAAGMTVEQFKVFQDMKRKYEAAMKREQLRAVRDGADQQMKAWEQEAESLKELYPSFSLETEVQNPRFLAMLKANVSMDAAYRALHMDEIMEAERKQTAQLTQQQVVASIRAKGTRPSENGTSGQSGFTIKDDVSKLSRKDRAEVARQVKQGKMISF